MNLSELIQMLKDVRRSNGGDLEVRLSADTEGNGFGSIGVTPFDVTDGKLYIYPEVDHLEHGE